MASSITELVYQVVNYLKFNNLKHQAFELEGAFLKFMSRPLTEASRNKFRDFVSNFYPQYCFLIEERCSDDYNYEVVDKLGRVADYLSEHLEYEEINQNLMSLILFIENSVGGSKRDSWLRSIHKEFYNNPMSEPYIELAIKSLENYWDKNDMPQSNGYERLIIMLKGAERIE